MKWTDDLEPVYFAFLEHDSTYLVSSISPNFGLDLGKSAAWVTVVDKGHYGSERTQPIWRETADQQT